MHDAGLQTNAPDVKPVLRQIRKSCILGFVSVTYADVLARNVRAARAAVELDQEPLAGRMRALGFTSWRHQTVARVEKGKRRLIAEELLGLALTLQTSVGDLMDPRLEDSLIKLPSGDDVDVMCVLRSVQHFNDGMVWWEDEEPCFEHG